MKTMVDATTCRRGHVRQQMMDSPGTKEPKRRDSHVIHRPGGTPLLSQSPPMPHFPTPPPSPPLYSYIPLGFCRSNYAADSLMWDMPQGWWAGPKESIRTSVQLVRWLVRVSSYLYSDLELERGRCGELFSSIMGRAQCLAP